MSPSAKREILLMVSGSIAAYKACHLVSRLVQAGHGVQVVASRSALRFVGAPTWEGLSGRAVVDDLFEAGRAMDHIHLVRRADLIIAAPATANLINRMAAGIGDDLMTTMFLAHDFKKPFLLAPAMNTSMYLHPATQGSLRKLREMGVGILETASGVLACGETGFGKLLDPDLMLAEIQRALAAPPAPAAGAGAAAPAASIATPGAPRGRVLITAGGTREPIDDVRVVTNLSTGRSGVKLADALSSLGHQVTLLKAKSAPAPATSDPRTIEFETFADLEKALRETLASGDFHRVVHMAAVSDYAVDHILLDGRETKDGKIPSGAKLTIEMKPTPKLIARLKDWAPAAKVAGFKLTSGANDEERARAAARVLEHADLVVGNDLSEIDDAKGVHPYVAYTRTGAEKIAGFAELTAVLARWIAEPAEAAGARKEEK